MNICMVSEDYDPSIAGVGVHLQNLVPELKARGHNIVVITSRKRHQPGISSAPGLTIYRNFSIPVSGFRHSVTTSRDLKTILHRHNIDVVHVHFLSYMAVQAVHAAKKLGIKAMYTYHMAEEILTSPFRWLPRVQSMISRQIVRFCNKFDLITFPSQRLLETTRAKGVSANCVFLGNAIAFQNSVSTPRPPRENRFTLLFVGRLSPEKNLAFLIRVFRIVLLNHPGAELWLAGDGPIREQLKGIATQLGIESKVSFLGYIPNAELPQYYDQADAFVLPSFFETQGMVCIEAMHFGKPLLVSSGIVSREELVDQGRNGFIFDPKNGADLLQWIDVLITRPELRLQMSRNSRLKASSFSLDAVVSSHEETYQRLVSATSGARAGQIAEIERPLHETLPLAAAK
ncbi:MAG TPA: glycosyltransferase [Planctomycetota bacterium]|nr:glycosyltransferase [Planctomycetota bacterium]